MVTFSRYPDDPRPRRAATALLGQCMSVDLICLGGDSEPKHESLGGLDIVRVPINHRRGSKASYIYNYFAFILMSAGIFALRSIRRRYDLVYVHNMPDVLVVSALGPKLLGAKVILDLHDPMPELMATIFGLDKQSLSVRFMQWLEKSSIRVADQVLTVNIACSRIFVARGCPPDKIDIVMNTPDETIFPLRLPRSYQPTRDAARPFVIMYHGSIVERNGLDLAVAAVGRMRQELPGTELRVYGHRTPFLERVMNDVRIHGLQNCIRYLGPRRLEDLPREIQDCDVGVIPSHRNAFTEINTPTRIFEYLALGKPVIAPRTPGIEDYFGPQSLFFFESGNAEDLAQKLTHVAVHSDGAIETAERGQEVYKAHLWARERQTLVDLVGGLFAQKAR